MSETTVAATMHAMIEQRGAEAPISRLMGFDFVRVEEPGRVVVAMNAEGRHANPMGTVHGGVFCDLADAAMGLSVASTLDAEESFTTLELKINFLKAVRQARLQAAGRIVRKGRTTCLVEADVTDEDGHLVARASSTCMILRGEAAAGR